MASKVVAVAVVGIVVVGIAAAAVVVGYARRSYNFICK